MRRKGLIVAAILETDPGEIDNLASLCPDLVKCLSKKMRNGVDNFGGTGTYVNNLKIDSEMLGQLKALGYIQ